LASYKSVTSLLGLSIKIIQKLLIIRSIISIIAKLSILIIACSKKDSEPAKQKYQNPLIGNINYRIISGGAG